MLNQLGFPIIFIIGQIMGWWYMKPHVEMLLKHLDEAVKQVEAARATEERAVRLTEESHRLSKQALERTILIEQKIDRLHPGQ